MQTDDSRPDPDALLEQVNRAEQARVRGKLKIFFGASAGVGKTYSMLEAAQKRRAEGVDVVVGYVELHGRSETEQLLDGLAEIPSQQINYRNIILREFDLDSALARKPTLILVDEYAHSNARGARHEKRWQDVEELLDAGINVYTTLNVQHLESLNDVVARITGARMRETIPDAVFDRADDVELIDLPPDDLLERLGAGKVYVPEAAQRATGNFFRKGNLLALRELALRAVAERVDAAMVAYREGRGIGRNWATRERLLVAIAPDGRAEQLVRSARRVAAGAQAEWIVAYVETPALMNLPRETRQGVTRALRLAESLGAETVTLTGNSIAEELVSHARAKNCSRIIISKPWHKSWLARLRGIIRRTQIVSLLAEVRDIDLLVVSVDEPDAQAGPPQRVRIERKSLRLDRYWKAIPAVALVTIISFLLYPAFDLTNLVMIYLLGVATCAFTLGRGTAVFSAILSVLTFDYLFVPPRFSFSVADAQYLVTFVIMLGIGLLIAELAARGRRQVAVARLRENRARTLYELSRNLTKSREIEQIFDVLVERTRVEFSSRAEVLRANPRGIVQDPGGFTERRGITNTLFQVLAPQREDGRLPRANSEVGVAQWAFDNVQIAGLGTDTLPGAKALYLPVVVEGRSIAVLALEPGDEDALLVPEQRHLIESFVSLAGMAAERALLAEATERARREIQAQELRNLMLSSISHDLRTPLTTIIGSATSLADGLAHESGIGTDSPGESTGLGKDARRVLVRGIINEAERMFHLIRNLLEMTRLDAGEVQMNRNWNDFEELLSSVRSSLAHWLEQRQVRAVFQPNMPLVECDGVLIFQVLANLLENAARHTPAGSAIDIDTSVHDGRMICQIRDYGDGLPDGSEQRVFEKFYQARPESGRAGLGLGLAICKAIIDLHGGAISAANVVDGKGSIFSFWLPLSPAPEVGEAHESEEVSAGTGAPMPDSSTALTAEPGSAL